ncbi:MAG: AsnC family transcriptional regulator [Nitrososphaerales archaeon]|jgi:DNA-binding Lrp family transcriptional regulator|nr:Lrp/AsnC family transcriptional regulator [Nitrososphaerota archaeon]
MDGLDEQILEILKKNSRTSFVEIAEEVNLSEAAIRRRIQNLLNEGTIKRFTIDQTTRKLSSALVLVVVKPGTATSTISGKIRAIQTVQKVYEITGEYEIGVILGASTTDGIRSTIEEIRTLDGVEDTCTSIILRDLD